VIDVKVRVAARPDELADAEVALLRDHVREQRIGGDVERHAEEHVGAALVQLARELAARHVELEQCVARRERHALELAHVPGID
jgi:ribosomal protein S13